jgi:prolyl-tRNA synthetase
MEETYKRIFTRLGLEFRVVEADSGAIGGSGSKEFMVLANSGEDTIVVCENCEYGANIEAAIRADVVCVDMPPEASFAKFNTPNIKTIEDLSEFFKVNPYYIMKTVAMRALYDEGKSEIVLFVLRGSDTLEETKACNATGANELVDVSEEELSDIGLVAGYMGAVDLNLDIKIIADNSLRDATNMICGANEDGYHFVGASSGQMKASYHDISAVLEGDVCSCCGGNLIYTKGIEVGHIFQLGTRYSEPLKAEFLDENGKTQPFVMGTYGIGVSRLLAAIIEQHHDEKGCIWTKESSPFDIHIIVSNSKDENQTSYANSIYDELKSENISVLMDDRKERFGFKMKDCELIGIPNILIIGQKLDDGIIELKKRTEEQGVEFKLDAILAEIKNRI